jgi:hypothetical protein
MSKLSLQIVTGVLGVIPVVTGLIGVIPVVTGLIGMFGLSDPNLRVGRPASKRVTR